MKKKLVLISLAVAVILIMSNITVFAGGPENTDDGLVDGVLSTRAITDSVMMGQKLVAVAVQYGHNVDATKLNLDTYSIMDMFYDTTFKEASIVAVYTNKVPELRADKTSVKGKYVIIETDPLDRVGMMVNYYVDPVTGEMQQYWLKPDVNATVRQNEDIFKDKGGVEQVLSEASPDWMAMTDATRHLKFEEFETLTLTSEVNVDTEGEPLDILSYYFLPDGYKKYKGKYAIVFMQCGAGLRYWEKLNSQGELINNAGACIAFDHSVTSWMRNGYEDVIVVSVDYRGTFAPPGYDAVPDINQVADYFIDNFKVDPSRVYYAGNSMGSMTGYRVINARPDLWAAFMPCNGLSTFGSNVNEAMLAQIEENMRAFAENKIAVYFQIGYEDFIAPGPNAQAHYDFMHDYYTAQGMTDLEINKILRLNLYYYDDYLGASVFADDWSYNPHLATKLAYTIDKANFMPWIFSQHK